MKLMKSLSQEKAETLRVLAGRIVPETADLDAAGMGRFFGLIDEALLERPPSVRRQFAAGALREPVRKTECGTAGRGAALV